MFLAKVVGNVWATKKIKQLENKRLLLIQAIMPMTGEVFGKIMMAVCHTIDAGVGDTVIIMDEGSSAGQHLGTATGPIRTFVFGIVDQVSQYQETKKYT